MLKLIRITFYIVLSFFLLDAFDILQTKIEFLNLNDCHNITDNGIKSFIPVFNELKTLFGQEGTTLASFVPVFIMSANERLDDVYKDREIFMNFLKEQTKK